MRCEIKLANGQSFFGFVESLSNPITVDMASDEGFDALTKALLGNATLILLESTNSYNVAVPAVSMKSIAHPNRIHF